MHNSTPRSLNWDDARFLIAAERCGSVARVAQSMMVNATTVTRRLENMETTMSAVLFLRNHGELRLSPLGLELLPFAETMERAARSIDSQINHATDNVAGEIRVSAPPSFARYILAPILSSLVELYPDISVELNMSAGNVDLNRSEADIALRLELPQDEASSIIARALGEMAYAPFGPTNGDANGRWIAFSRNYDHTPEGRWLNKQLGGNPAVLRCNDPEIMANAAGKGAGNTLLAVHLGLSRPNLQQIGPVALTRKIWMLQHRDIAKARHIQVFTQWLVQMCNHKLGRAQQEAANVALPAKI